MAASRQLSDGWCYKTGLCGIKSKSAICNHAVSQSQKQCCRITDKLPAVFPDQLLWLRHGAVCEEGVRQMGCVWYLSLNVMRWERASPILGPVWWQETQCPLIREGSFPSSKIMRWQCIQLSLDRDRGPGGRDGGRNILQHLSAAFDQTGCHSLYQHWTPEGPANYFITVSVTYSL